MEQKILKKIIVLLIIILGLLFGFYIFKLINDDFIAPEKIVVQNSEFKLKYGNKIKIEAKVLPETATNKNLNWISSNPELVTVDENGYVFVNKNEDGEAIIQVVSQQNLVSTCVRIKVVKEKNIISATNIQLDKSTVTLNYNESITVNATVLPSNATNKNVIWSSSDSGLVDVDNNGIIKAISNKNGQAIITATTVDGKKKATVIVNVKKIDVAVKVTGIKLNKSTITLNYNESATINATISPSNATNKNIIWSSSDSSLVTVDNNGIIKAISNKNGQAIITATSVDEQKKATVVVNVKKMDETVKVTGIKLNKSTVTLNYNESATINATISPSNATNKNITWSSSNSSLVTVDSNGKIKAVSNKNGQATITATSVDEQKKATVVVNVKKLDETVKVTGIKLNKSTVTLNYNESATINATISPSNATNKNITWSSSNSSLVTVDSNGKIKAVSNKNDQATITATTKDGKYKASVKVTVKAKSTTIKVTGITINQGSGKTVYLNNKNSLSFNLTATISPSNATNKKISWSSNNTSVATVDSNGKVTAKNLGVAKITATSSDGSYKSTYKLTVKQKTIIVITASAGVRMDKWFETYTSSNSNYYSENLGTLKYIYKSGSGFDFQHTTGLEKAKQYINSKYTNKKDYVELSIFFTLTGNSVKKFTCDDINKSSEYLDIASKYNNAIEQIKSLGYSNTTGYVISHSPLNTKHPLASKNNIVYSHKKEACESGYRSAWKYWLSNKRMKSVISKGSYSNIKFIDNFSNFVVIKDESKRTFTWLRAFSTPADDALHWDEPTTKSYMQLAFDTAGM